MRIVRSIASTLTIVALTGLGAQALPSAPSPAPVRQAAAQPAEDSPRFDCRKHGNRQCGVRLDPKPNDGKKQSVWYVISFNKDGKPVSVRTR